MMADSDPFSGIPLSGALSDSDNSSLSRVLSLALAETDDIYQPVARALANFIATKISGLTQVKIARLSDVEIARLIETELSRLPEGEMHRILNADISSFLDGCKDSLIRFSATILLRLLKGLHQICSSKYFEVVFVTGASLLILTCYYKSYQRMIKNSPSYKYEVRYEVLVASNVAQKKLKCSERCLNFITYSKEKLKFSERCLNFIAYSKEKLKFSERCLNIITYLRTSDLKINFQQELLKTLKRSIYSIASILKEQPKTSMWSVFLSNTPDLKGFKDIEATNTAVRRVSSASDSIVSNATI